MKLNIVKIPKKQTASRGFSNKSKKPRKKNLMAFGNIITKNADITPIPIRGNEFFNLVIILTIIYNVNIRNFFHSGKLFLIYFHSLLSYSLCLPTLNHPKDTTF